jgi:hypothetical protein
VDVEESIHLVTKTRKAKQAENDKLTLVAAQTQSINFANMNHLQADNDESINRPKAEK